MASALSCHNICVELKKSVYISYSAYCQYLQSFTFQRCSQSTHSFTPHFSIPSHLKLPHFKTVFYTKCICTLCCQGFILSVACMRELSPLRALVGNSRLSLFFHTHPLCLSHSVSHFLSQLSPSLSFSLILSLSRSGPI